MLFVGEDQAPCRLLHSGNRTTQTVYNKQMMTNMLDLTGVLTSLLGQCVIKTGKEGNVLFNDALNIIYIQLYGVRDVVKDHSDSEKGNTLSD